MKGPAPKIRRRVIKDEGPDPIDVFVGNRVRERRLQKSLPLSTVAAQLGVTFQAVQRYETGGNRIAASTLFRLAQVLAVDPNYFFDGCKQLQHAITGLTRLELKLRGREWSPPQDVPDR